MADKKNDKQLLKTDIPLAVLVVLALLTVPRVVLHDLHTISLDSPLYTTLAVAPFILWLLVAIFRKNKRPVHDFLVLGLLFGILLAITHQLTWDASWGNNPPHLHGNLEGKLDPTIESLLLRGAAFISSLVTGVIFGGGVALVAWIVAKVRGVIK